MLKNVGKDGFEILGQTFLRAAPRGAARNKVSVLTGNRFGESKNVGKDGFEILGQTAVPSR